MIDVRHGDSCDALPTLAEASIDACVTDPPYSLQTINKRFAKVGRNDKTWSSSGPHQRTVAGFMNQKWDTGETAFAPEFWAEVLRVLKPGAHVVAFGGDRTFHRLACAIEDAGFEIRGTIAWVFGSGFPKNHNVSKRLVDSLPAGALRACDLCDWQIVQGSQGDCSSRRDPDGEQSQSAEGAGRSVSPSRGDAREHSRGDQRQDDRAGAQASIFPDAENGHRATARLLHPSDLQSVGCRGHGSIPSDTASSMSPDESTAGHKILGRRPSTRRSDDDLASETWYANLPQCQRCGKRGIPQGLGTALKPAMEMICLARKPLAAGTVAANVQQHGTGALNIDGCRVETGARPWREARRNEESDASRKAYGKGLAGSKAIDDTTVGRWPANLIHDGSEEVLAAFPGDRPGGGAVRTTAGSDARDVYGKGLRDVPKDGMGDSGSAARFFYSAKADADDRLGSKHPTVKPVDLMAYLVRLVTPPGGTVLDPFAGSGTTGMACMREGFDCILIEREAAYVADIRRRLAHVHGTDTPLFAVASA